MTHMKIANPFAAYAWIAEAGWVFLAHSAQLWADPGTSGARLAALGAEKQQAFSEGVFRASAAALRGAHPNVVAQAAMSPIRRRVRANARRIGKLA
jgi:hypothetical protein